MQLTRAIIRKISPFLVFTVWKSHLYLRMLHGCKVQAALGSRRWNFEELPTFLAASAVVAMGRNSSLRKAVISVSKDPTLADEDFQLQISGLGISFITVPL